MTYNVVLVSGVQQSDSVMFFQIIFCYMLLHVIEHSSLYYIKVKVKLLSRVQLCTTSWTVAYQAPLSMGFSRQEYWSGLPCPSPVHESEQ